MSFGYVKNDDEIKITEFLLGNDLFLFKLNLTEYLFNICYNKIVQSIDWSDKVKGLTPDLILDKTNTNRLWHSLLTATHTILINKKH